MFIPVDAARFADGIQFLSAEPSPVFESGRRVEGRQRTDSQGVLQWNVQVLLLRNGRRAQLVTVRVSSPVAPDIAPTTPVVFRDLVATTWQQNGRAGVSLSASGVMEA